MGRAFKSRAATANEIDALYRVHKRDLVRYAENGMCALGQNPGGY